MEDQALAVALSRRGWPERPLTGERPAVDLLNTRWLVGSAAFDVLDDDRLTSAWLTDRAFEEKWEGTRENLRTTRDALAAVVAGPADTEALDLVLDQGRLRLQVHGAIPDVPDPAWRSAWACARDYVDLLDHAPGRIRKCANPVCVLHFVDHSRKGDRRWCSMAACGNRTKARRHRERQA